MIEFGTVPGLRRSRRTKTSSNRRDNRDRIRRTNAAAVRAAVFLPTAGGSGRSYGKTRVKHLLEIGRVLLYHR